MNARPNNSDKPVALVTGGGRGIGLGIARSLAQSGFDIAFSGRKPASAVADVIRLLSDDGAAAHYCQSDVADSRQRAKLVDDIRDRFGRIDVLVNNAGIAADVRADILEASEESFDKLIAVNLKGPYFLTQLVARWMIELRRTNTIERGRIINITSVSATIASLNRGDYCISKAGAAMASRQWAARLAEFGIDVYEVRPGVVCTDMTAVVKEKYDRLIAEGLTLDRRWGTPEDIGRAVTALARGDIPYATGQVLNIDGGMTIQVL